MESIKKQESSLAAISLHLAIVEFLIFSGGIYMTNSYLGNGTNALFVFCFTTFFRFLSVDSMKLERKNVKRWLFITIWVFLVTFVFGQGSHDMSIMMYVLYSASVLLLISSTDFDRFRNLLLNYLVVLSIVSIIVQLGHDYLGIFNTNNTYIKASGDVVFYTYVFNTEWGENRLASIYWEPGQYQIVIFYTLVLFAEEWSVLSKWRENLKKFGVLFVALFMTISTTAYLMMMLMVIIVFVKSSRNHLRLIPIYFAFGAVAVFFLYNSDAVQDKEEQRESGSDRTSYAVRLADNLGCLMVTLDDPLTGYGIGSSMLENRLLSEGSETSSNGWLYGSAQMGIPYILFILICIWKNLKRMSPHTNTLLLFALLVLSQCNEYFITFPYMYMYIFEFLYSPHSR